MSFFLVDLSSLKQAIIAENKKKLHDAKSGKGNRVALQNTHKGKLQLAKWNKRSLKNPEFLKCVKNEMRKNNISLKDLTEVRWKGRGDIEDDGFIQEV